MRKDADGVTVSRRTGGHSSCRLHALQISSAERSMLSGGAISTCSALGFQKRQAAFSTRRRREGKTHPRVTCICSRTTYLRGDLRRRLGRSHLRCFEFIRLLFWFGVCPARETPERSIRNLGAESHHSRLQIFTWSQVQPVAEACEWWL